MKLYLAKSCAKTKAVSALQGSLVEQPEKLQVEWSKKLVLV